MTRDKMMLCIVKELSYRFIKQLSLFVHSFSRGNNFSGYYLIFPKSEFSLRLRNAFLSSRMPVAFLFRNSSAKTFTMRDYETRLLSRDARYCHRILNYRDLGIAEEKQWTLQRE